MRILVVEDEHRIANTIKKGLEQERFAVDVAYDGVSGYDLASAEDYDLVILDLMLPQMDGLTVVKKLRENNNQVPILVLTAKSLVGDRVRGLDIGADDYLTKPFAFAELVARVRALSRRPKKALRSELVVENLKLDAKNFKLEKAGKKIDLTAKEFTMLEYLMRHAGTTLSKDQIIDHVWNYDADVLPNTVEVYIRNLRNKIGKSIIQTLRGFGYKLGE